MSFFDTNAGSLEYDGGFDFPSSCVFEAILCRPETLLVFMIAVAVAGGVLATSLDLSFASEAINIASALKASSFDGDSASYQAPMSTGPQTSMIHLYAKPRAHQEWCTLTSTTRSFGGSKFKCSASNPVNRIRRNPVAPFRTITRHRNQHRTVRRRARKYRRNHYRQPDRVI